MTDPFDWVNAEYYWKDDLIYMDMRDECDPCENPFGPGDYDEDEDYPFDEEQYESFLDLNEA